MKVDGEIKFVMSCGEANDLRLELCDILSLVSPAEEAGKHRALIAVCELYSKLQSCLKEGKEHNSWDSV